MRVEALQDKEADIVDESYATMDEFRLDVVDRVIPMPVIIAGKRDLLALQLEQGKRTRRNKATMFADPVFTKACELAEVAVTKRQASKFNNGYGAAFAKRGLALQELHPERYTL